MEGQQKNQEGLDNGQGYLALVNFLERSLIKNFKRGLRKPGDVGSNPTGAIMFTYLFGSLLAFVVWIIFYCIRQDLRREMLTIGMLTAILGILGGLLGWTQDWWHPETITGTPVGIEDFIFGFSYGGFASVVFQVLEKKKSTKKFATDWKKFLIPASGFAAIFLLFFIFHQHSFYASAAGMLIPAGIIYFLRHDLIRASIFTGIVTAIGAMIGFFILNLLQPNFVQQWWMLNKLSGILIFGLPFEDLAWFFSAGLLFGPLYTFWHGREFTNI